MRIVHLIIHSLGYHSVAANWIQRFLTDEQNNTLGLMSLDVVTMNHNSNVRKCLYNLRRRKNRLKSSEGKEIVTIFFNYQFLYFNGAGININAERNANTLQPLSLKNTGPGKLTNVVILCMIKLHPK